MTITRQHLADLLRSTVIEANTWNGDRLWPAVADAAIAALHAEDQITPEPPEGWRAMSELADGHEEPVWVACVYDVVRTAKTHRRHDDVHGRLFWRPAEPTPAYPTMGEKG